MKNPYTDTSRDQLAERRRRVAALHGKIEISPDEHLEPPLPEPPPPRLIITASRDVLRGLKAHGAPINYVPHDGKGAQARRLRQLERQRAKAEKRASVVIALREASEIALEAWLDAIVERIDNDEPAF